MASNQQAGRQAERNGGCQASLVGGELMVKIDRVRGDEARISSLKFD